MIDWTDLRLAAEAAEWLERQPAGVYGADDIEQRFRKLATPRAVLALISAADADPLDILIDDAFEKLGQQSTDGRLTPETDAKHSDNGNHAKGDPND